MKAMELSRRFWTEVAEPDLKKNFPDIYPHAAVGLAGNGSECFGFEDELSRDHDWGTDFCLWLPEDMAHRAPELQQWKAELLAAHPEYPQREQSLHGARCMAETAGSFYKRHIGSAGVPATVRDWLVIPEENLAMTVNGQVFYDGAGDFSRIRAELLEHYPPQLRLKRLAARCMMLAQTGQYNLPRSLRREHEVTAAVTRLRFVEEAIKTGFLLNRVYCPYYKWAFPAMEKLPILAGEVSPLIKTLASENDTEAAEALCVLIAEELRRQGLSSTTDNFLACHGEEIQASIIDPLLASLPAQYG